MDGEISGFLGPNARPFDWWWKVAPFMRWRSLEIIQKWELFMVLFMVLMVQKNLDALNGGIQFSNQKKPSSRNASGPRKKCHFGEVKWCFKPLEFVRPYPIQNQPLISSQNQNPRWHLVPISLHPICKEQTDQGNYNHTACCSKQLEEPSIDPTSIIQPHNRILHLFDEILHRHTEYISIYIYLYPPVSSCVILCLSISIYLSIPIYLSIYLPTHLPTD